MRRVVFSLLAAFSLLLGVTATANASSSPPLPRSMAAIGDSMTQAADACCWYGDHPDNSWSTGSAGWDGISSHYERIRALNGAISEHAFNDSVSGARMDAAPSQAVVAVEQGVQYVTILMGGNDVCTSSLETMTPVATFRKQYQSALASLDRLPDKARILVASIPDIYQLWQLYHTDAVAQFVWGAANVCQSMLSPTRTEADRQTVRQRNIDFNTVLRQECAKYSRCKFDRNAVFNYQLDRSQISKLDYFHPSLSGQATLARVTWDRGWWR
ncbi:MAG: GDSL-type esterase/lipase family protein [Dermatophilaceae bacterium]